MRMNIKGVIGEVTPLPGCTQIAVSHGVFLPEELRGKNLGTTAHTDRLMELKNLGYDVAICTVNSTNKAQLNILVKHGWELLFNFKSSKTGNSVGLWFKRL